MVGLREISTLASSSYPEFTRNNVPKGTKATGVAVEKHRVWSMLRKEVRGSHSHSPSWWVFSLQLNTGMACMQWASNIHGDVT
jgi:hypothetical protein